MKILYRYIAKNFAKIFILTLSIFIFVGIISEFLRQREFYSEYKTPFSVILPHLLSCLPSWLMQAFPIITLLALLFSLGDLSKKNEITAIKAAGINIWKIISVFLTLGFVVGVSDLAIRELIVVKTQKYNDKLKKEKIQKDETQKETEFSNLIFFMPNNTRVTVGYLNTNEKIMKDIVIEKYNNEFAIKRLILSEEAVWKNGIWLLKKGVIRNFSMGSWDETYFKNYKSDINIKPVDMVIHPASDNSMNTLAFKRYIDHRKILGQESVKEKIALNTRYASAFSHITVMLIGIPFAIGLGVKVSRILNFTFALTATFIYWCIQAITRSIGENLVLQPFLAAWLPNFIYITIGVYILIIKVKK